MRTVHRYVRVEAWSNHRHSVAVRLTENRGFTRIVLLIATVAPDMLSEVPGSGVPGSRSRNLQQRQ